MNTHRPRRIDRKTAERLLRGDRAVPEGGPDPLADLLAAATAPPRADELAGEQAALAAFREAHLVGVHQSRRGSMIKTSIAKLLTVKAAAAAVAATAVGGVALAASTGTLPSPLHHSTSTAHPTARPTGGPASGEPSAAAAGAAHASPSPSLVGLCHAYTAGAGHNPGKALDNPAFTALITAAGGKDKVAAYCAKILSDRPGNASATHRPGGAPTAHPTGAPATHPAGDSGHRSGKPSTHPTGEPATRPDR